MRPSEIKKGRLIFVYSLILLAFFIIIARMIFLVASGDKIKIKFIYDHSKINRRGEIYDRNQTLLASDLKTKSLYISSILIKDEKSIAAGIARIFDDLSYDEVLHKIIAGKKRHDWILIRRNITPLQEQQVNNLKKAGLIFEDDSIRVYPQRSILSHLVGYVDLDRKGLAGIERQYDKILRKDQEKLQLAADVRLQDILYDELRKALDEFNAGAASGVILDATNGEVLALASLPSFDPNLQSDASQNQRFNRATNGVYELGSIFKIFTNAIAFDKNLVKASDQFDISDPIKYGRFTINDDHPEKGRHSVAEIFAKSSNIGTVQIAQKIGIDNQKEYMKRLNFLEKLDSDFAELGRPISPRIWREINLWTIAYGHGIAVTPLHIAAAAASVINGGIFYQPAFAKLTEQPKGKRIFSEDTSKKMREMLRNVVIEGTGKKADIEGYEVGGKTGTAEKAQGGGYNKKQTLASFLGVFPMSEPKYVVYIVIDSPNAMFNTGGMVAAPVAGRIIKNIAPIVGVLPR